MEAAMEAQVSFRRGIHAVQSGMLPRVCSIWRGGRRGAARARRRRRRRARARGCLKPISAVVLGLGCWRYCCFLVVALFCVSGILELSFRGV